MLEAGVGTGGHRGCLAQQGLAAISAGDQPGGPQRHAEGARGAESTGQLDLFVTELLRSVGFTQSKDGQGGVGTPRQVARARRQAADGDLTGRPKVAERLTESALSEPNAAPGVTQYVCRHGSAREVGGHRNKSPRQVLKGGGRRD